MPFLAKQSRRKLHFLRGVTFGGLFGQLTTAIGGAGMRDASLESCLEYLEYLENVEIDSEEPVEGPPACGQRQTMLFDELS